MITVRRCIFGLCAVILAGMFTSQSANAQVQGTLFTKKGTQVTGQLRYRPSSKDYQITANGITSSMALSDVLSVTVNKPAGFEEASRMVAAGKNVDAAIATLTKIADDYTMLEYDVKAAGFLADAYFQKDNMAKVIECCEKIIRGNPEAAYSGDMAPKYWTALLKMDNTSKLKTLLDQAASKGPDRESAARALIMRGDIDAKKSEFKTALIDGYLRVVVMFQDVKEVQPLALAKSMKAFEDLGQIPYAEKMRKRLLSEYPDSEEAKKISK